MTTYNKRNYCVILAGGKGRRLWPCSRERQPKQFVDFFSTGRTLLQETFDRVKNFIPLENIYVSTNHEYAHFVVEQLPELPKENVLSEPIFRNTAPSVAWATYRIYHRDENARMMVIPSDHTVIHEDRFSDNMLRGMDMVDSFDHILTMGVKPTRPETGYGYIQKGDPTDTEHIYKVKSFTEKPDAEFAKLFMESGEFLWNTGIYIANVQHMRLCLHKIFPAVFRILEAREERVSLEDELIFIEEKFSSYPNISIDYGLLDNNEDVCVMESDFGWADLGMWHSIYDTKKKVEGDNVVIDTDVILEECKGNIIKLPKGRLGVIQGLEGYIIAEQGNVLLICKKGDSSALIRKYVNDVKLNHGEEYV